MLKVIAVLPEFDKITAVEVNLERAQRSYQAYKRFFRHLPNMRHLRVLRLFGCPFHFDFRYIWRLMLRGFDMLPQITELSIDNLLRNTEYEDLLEFCEAVPVGLQSLTLCRMRFFDETHIQRIAERCTKLDTFYGSGLWNLSSNGVEQALLHLCNLRQISLCDAGPVPSSAYHLLSDSKATPHIQAVILGGNTFEPKIARIAAGLDAVFRRLPQFRTSGEACRWRGYEYHMWRDRRAYDELLAASSHADCPGCGRDMGLIEGSTL
ncbi:unnamed protein product [Gongylonema pulchrum]|uniref:F-box/LRR-repeat protein 7 n=1 Tax=Gongylonema pulchrum TaxID=637853 RepID=A0A183DV73_9BILA|nr:unnamed protein product [Gongylonema pulchrum]